MRPVGNLLEGLDIGDLKRESLLKLSRQKHIREFLDMNHLRENILDEYWVEFLDYHDDVMTCQNCQSLNQCPKENPGLEKVLKFYDNKVIVELEACQFGQVLKERKELLKRFVIKNVHDDILEKDFVSLDLCRSTPLSNYNEITLTYLLQYLKSPNHIGLFLHGDSGVGKTTILASLMYELTKRGHEVGFVHFPTYLLDLKASFGSGENQGFLDKVMNVEYLVLDAIGEENATAWSRDEILLTILSYRQINKLPTFFTSLYGYKELKQVYTIKKGDEIRANTLLTKMKALSKELIVESLTKQG